MSIDLRHRRRTRDAARARVARERLGPAQRELKPHRPRLPGFVRGRTLPWALVVLALAAAAVLFVLWQGAQAEQRHRAEVASTATSFLQALTNFDAASIQADVSTIRGYAVGDFADQVNTFFGPQVTDAIQQARAKSVGRVRSLFVESLTATTAEVFGVIDETVTNAGSPTPRSQVVRIELSLVRTTAGWKVDRVDILQSPQDSPLQPTLP